MSPRENLLTQRLVSKREQGMSGSKARIPFETTAKKADSLDSKLTHEYSRRGLFLQTMVERQLSQIVERQGILRVYRMCLRKRRGRSVELTGGYILYPEVIPNHRILGAQLRTFFECFSGLDMHPNLRKAPCHSFEIDLRCA